MKIALATVLSILSGILIVFAAATAGGAVFWICRDLGPGLAAAIAIPVGTIAAAHLAAACERLTLRLVAR